MKIHSLLFCHDKDDGCRYVLDSGYFAKLSKGHDPILTDNLKEFYKCIRDIMDMDSVHKYYITGQYTKKTHMLQFHETGEKCYSKHAYQSDIGWKKLMRIAKKVLGSDFEITHKKFQDKVYITKKV